MRRSSLRGVRLSLQTSTKRPYVVRWSEVFRTAREKYALWYRQQDGLCWFWLASNREVTDNE